MAKSPHILLFNPDQWRGDTLGCMGDPAVHTPVIDRLVAEEATAFRWAFCQNPVCTPSRCSFMTGWYPHVRGHRTMHHMLHPEHGEDNLLAVLRRNGWRVFWGGKNDLLPSDQIATSADHRTRLDRFDLDPNWHNGPLSSSRGTPGSDTYYSFFIGRLQARPGELWYRDNDWARVQDAIRCIEAHDPSQPLCLYLPLDYPHPPYAVEDPFFSDIVRGKLPPRIRDADWSGKPAMVNTLRERLGLADWDERRWDELRSVYRGMCARVDALLGLVIDALRRRGMWDDTLMCLFSDHGDFTGDYGLVEKTQNTFEDCLVRVPLVVKPPTWAGGKAGISDALTELVDVSETIYDLCGIDPGYDRFGRSLLPQLRREQTEHRDAVFCEGGRRRGEAQAMEVESLPADREQHPYWPRLGLQASDEGPWHGKASMCRTRTWKYVRRLYESDELYDLVGDPGERVNRIADPACAVIRSELQDRLLCWYQDTCDVVPRTCDRR
jgi:arylsulfatase A-like enzyme